MARDRRGLMARTLVCSGFAALLAACSGGGGGGGNGGGSGPSEPLGEICDPSADGTETASLAGLRRVASLEGRGTGSALDAVAEATRLDAAVRALDVATHVQRQAESARLRMLSSRDANVVAFSCPDGGQYLLGDESAGEDSRIRAVFDRCALEGMEVNGTLDTTLRSRGDSLAGEVVAIVDASDYTVTVTGASLGSLRGRIEQSMSWDGTTSTFAHRVRDLEWAEVELIDRTPGITPVSTGAPGLGDVRSGVEYRIEDYAFSRRLGENGRYERRFESDSTLSIFATPPDRRLSASFGASAGGAGQLSLVLDGSDGESGVDGDQNMVPFDQGRACALDRSDATCTASGFGEARRLEVLDRAASAVGR